MRSGKPPYDGAMDARLTAIETLLPTLMTKTDGAELRVEMQKIAGETHKWMLATVIGLFLGFGGLFLAAKPNRRPSSSTCQAHSQLHHRLRRSRSEPLAPPHQPP